MRKSILHICLFAVSLVVLVSCSREQYPTLRGLVTAGVPVPEDALLNVLKRHHVPGVSIAVVHRGRIDWAKGYGVREYGRTERVDSTTLFQAASISKPVAAVLALRMVERGELALDEDVNLKP
jgi:CubicO group peptidase (beta-lactamase class C family)